jgi:hypothetical protein
VGRSRSRQNPLVDHLFKSMATICSKTADKFRGLSTGFSIYPMIDIGIMPSSGLSVCLPYMTLMIIWAEALSLVNVAQRGQN